MTHDRFTAFIVRRTKDALFVLAFFVCGIPVTKALISLSGG